MLIRLFVCLLALLPLSAFAQTQSGDTLKRSMTEECNDRAYSKVEVLPSIKKGIKSLEDSLTAYLKANNAFPANMRGTYSFMITTTPFIMNVNINGEENPGQDALVTKFILNSRELWKPAVQNGVTVCALVDLVIIIRNGALKAVITQ